VNETVENSETNKKSFMKMGRKPSKPPRVCSDMRPLDTINHQPGVNKLQARLHNNEGIFESQKLLAGRKREASAGCRAGHLVRSKPSTELFPCALCADFPFSQ
jgi:hypothetical protein